MKFVIQRVKNASVTIDNKLYSSIGKGLLIFFCAEKNDENNAVYSGKNLSSDGVLDYFADKILKLRIFEDENGKMNRSLLDISGEILVVSQFTLAANCKKGTRPSFDTALAPDKAKKMYEDFMQKLQTRMTALTPSLQNSRKMNSNSTIEENIPKNHIARAFASQEYFQRESDTMTPVAYDNISHETAFTIADLNSSSQNSPNARVKTGVFAADMQISLVNDGPVTIIL